MKLVDIWEVYEMVGRFGRPLGDWCVFLEVFPQFGLRIGHYWKTYKIPCIYIRYS